MAKRSSVTLGKKTPKIDKLWRELEKAQETGCRKELRLPSGKLDKRQKKTLQNCVARTIQRRYIEEVVLKGRKTRMSGRRKKRK